MYFMKKLLFLCLIVTTFISCKKDKDDECELTTAAMAANYKVSAVRYKATATSAETDYFNAWFTDACERDDVVSLNANGTYVFTDAGVVCSPPGDDTGTWSISGNNFITDGFSYNIDAHTCTSITVSTTNVLVSGDKVILVLTRQ